MDHAGSTLYASTQLESSFRELSSGLFTNPHSHHGAATAESTSGKMERVRRQVMRFFSADPDEYALVFTSGATAALKLVGECFPWSDESVFAHSVDSHTSVLGIRGYASKHGATTACVSLEELNRLESPSEAENGQVHTSDAKKKVNASLFAFPAECNFSGALHSLSIAESVRHGEWHHQRADSSTTKWFVLVDAAKFAATHPLDLSEHRPDFVVMSFYKLFGYPTGLGALLVRKTALPFLQKTYYGGGTVKSILATSNFVVPRDATQQDVNSSPFADGTQSYLSIASLRHGLDRLEQLNMTDVESHTTSLTQFLASQLATHRHWNGRPICELYGNHNQAHRRQGSIVACNFLRPDGSYVGYSEVHKLAEIHNIHLRTGCFCNPGACQHYLGLSTSHLLATMKAGHVCGDDIDIVDGLPTGAVRLSIGYMTTFEDVAAVLSFVDKYFVGRVEPEQLSQRVVTSSSAEYPIPRGGMPFLRKITLFPIKSCGGMVVDAWPVGERGLLFDREWAIIDRGTGAALSLKDTPRLCFVRPVVDLKHQTLSISFSDHPDCVFTMPLHGELGDGMTKSIGADPLDIRVCLGACKANGAGDAVSEWISARLGRECSLVRVSSKHLRKSTATIPKRLSRKHSSLDREPNPAESDGSNQGTEVRGAEPTIGFANQAQYLLISRQSIDNFNSVLDSVSPGMQVHEDAFRANFIVDGCAAAFAEDKWRLLRIGDAAFDVSGPCSRCSVINMDQRTGAFDRRPLQALSSYRRERSNIFFGQFLTRRAVVSDAEEDGVAKGIVWLRTFDEIAVEVAP